MTHVSWSTLAKEFDYCVHCVAWSCFKAVYRECHAKVRSKRSNLLFYKCQQKVSIRCILSSAIRRCLLFSYTTSETCSTMILNYKHCPAVSLTRIQKIEISCKSAVTRYLYQAEIFNTCSSWCVLLHIFRFSPKNHFLIKKYIFEKKDKIIVLFDSNLCKL